MTPLEDTLVAKVKVLTEALWNVAVDWPAIRAWLDNFSAEVNGHSQRVHALFLLSQFMYLGSRELRELLRALYRDLYRYPIVEQLRRSNGDSLDCAWLREQLSAELERTRFLGVGNPSESGTHLLYTFRQENHLKRELFINSHEIFDRVGGPTSATSIRFPDVSRYVFLDDFCGSGTQAARYSRRLVADIKRLQPAARVSYYSLFATTTGLAAARNGTQFDSVEAVCELDETFQAFGASSRYFRLSDAALDKAFAEATCRAHGERLWTSWPLGYRDGQLLIGFFHNIPDNTLPVIWHGGTEASPWTPVFRRYPKLYVWGGV